MAGLESTTSAYVPTLRVRATLNRLAEHVDVPAVHEIPVEAKTRRVPVAEHEPPPLRSAGGTNVVDAVQHLEKQMHKRHRVRRRAIAVVDAAEVRDVALVCLVEIHAVPAGLEMHLRPESVRAARLREMGRFFLGLGVQACEADALGDFAAAVRQGGGEGAVVEAAGVLVAGKHAQARGEGLQVGAVGAAAEVVDGHAVSGDFLECFVGVLVVEQGGPVGRSVVLDFAGGAIGGLEGGVGGVGRDVGGAGDFVNVVGGLAWVGDGVDAGGLDDGAGHSPEGAGDARQGG